MHPVHTHTNIPNTLTQTHPLTSQAADKKHPAPVQHTLNAVAYGKGQTIAYVDPEVVNADGRAPDFSGKVISNQ